MGAAAMMGLGLALAQPTRRVVVVTGDGEMLMAMGAFATIGAKAPEEFVDRRIDNEHYSETGMQPTHTVRGVDPSGIAEACSFSTVQTVYTEKELGEAIGPLFKGASPMFCDIKVNTQRYPMSIRMRDGAHIKNRFREEFARPEGFRLNEPG